MGSCAQFPKGQEKAEFRKDFATAKKYRNQSFRDTQNEK
jgi:hypothetical protein